MKKIKRIALLGSPRSLGYSTWTLTRSQRKVLVSEIVVLAEVLLYFSKPELNTCQNAKDINLFQCSHPLSRPPNSTLRLFMCYFLTFKTCILFMLKYK